MNQMVVCHCLDITASRIDINSRDLWEGFQREPPEKTNKIILKDTYLKNISNS